jgi:hypothetical protein
MGLPKTFMKLGNICFALSFVGFAGLMYNGFIHDASRFENWTDIWNAPFFQKGFWLILMIGSIAGSGIFHVAALLFGKRIYTQLVKNGQDAEAKVLAIDDTGTRINNDPLVKISIEVQPPNGPAFKTEVKQTVPVLFLPYLQPGKFVRVKYTPGTEKVAIVGAKNS